MNLGFPSFFFGADSRTPHQYQLDFFIFVPTNSCNLNKGSQLIFLSSQIGRERQRILINYVDV